MGGIFVNLFTYLMEFVYHMRANVNTTNIDEKLKYLIQISQQFMAPVQIHTPICIHRNNDCKMSNRIIFQLSVPPLNLIRLSNLY